jgi:hypothetical protein
MEKIINPSNPTIFGDTDASGAMEPGQLEAACEELVSMEGVEVTHLEVETQVAVEPQEEEQRSGFRPRKNSVYHTGDFKTAVSQAVRDLMPREPGETVEQYFVRTNEHELWKNGMHLNKVLMDGRDHELRQEIDIVSGLIEAFEGKKLESKQDKYTLLMCQTFVARGRQILEARQADRERRRSRDVEGFFSLAARCNIK